MDNRIFCRRDDLTIFAVYSPKEWFALRKAGTLDADLKRRRESGTIIEVEREPETLAPAHEPPRATMYPRGEVFASEAPANLSADGLGRSPRVGTGSYRTPPARYNEG